MRALDKPPFSRRVALCLASHVGYLKSSPEAKFELKLLRENYKAAGYSGY